MRDLAPGSTTASSPSSTSASLAVMIRLGRQTKPLARERWEWTDTTPDAAGDNIGECAGETREGESRIGVSMEISCVDPNVRTPRRLAYWPGGQVAGGSNPCFLQRARPSRRLSWRPRGRYTVQHSGGGGGLHREARARRAGPSRRAQSSASRRAKSLLTEVRMPIALHLRGLDCAAAGYTRPKFDLPSTASKRPGWAGSGMAAFGR